MKVFVWQIKRIYLGLKNFKKDILTFMLLFGAIGGYLQILQIFFFHQFSQYADLSTFIIFLIFTIIITIFYLRLPSEITFKIPNSNTKVRIIYGDLFKQSGCIVIPVNEYFYTEVGQKVAKLSVHGKFIELLYKNNEKVLGQEIHKYLYNQKVKKRVISQKLSQYPIGTVAVIEKNSNKYFLLALSHTNLKTQKANSDISSYIQALEGLWKSIYENNNMVSVYMPLIGSGLSGVGLDPNILLQLIVTSISLAAKKYDIPSTISIVLTYEIVDQINLNMLENWR